MIKEMLNNKAVGQYAVAVKLSEAWYFIPVVITNSLFPSIINAKKQSEELYYFRLQKLYDFMVWMAMAIALPMTFLAGWLVNVLFGPEYSQAANVLKINIWAGLFVSLGVASGKWLLTENLQMLSFWRTFCGALANVVLNLFMIPKYGIQGAAIATLLSQALAAYIFDLFNFKTRKTFFMKTKSFFLLNLITNRSLNA
jgi:O-antigen/teichoic acid export membrane protein